MRENIDWKAVTTTDIQDTSEEFKFEPLKGEFEFMVDEIEFDYYDGSDKIPACDVVHAYLAVNKNGKTVRTRDSLYLTSLDWTKRKVGMFLTSIGMQKALEDATEKGIDPFKDDIIGKLGRAKFDVTSSGDKQYNNVKAYILPLGKDLQDNEVPF